MAEVPINKKIIMWIITSALFMEMIDTTIINTAIPEISVAFKTHPINLKFAVTSYLISLAIFIPISGWAADRFGTKNIFLISIIIFTISSIFCGFSNSLIELSAFRAIQGFGGALMTPVARLIMVRVFPPTELVKATMYIFLPALLGPVLGPLIGGILTTYVSWRWIFFINIPIGITALYFAKKYIQNEVATNKPKLDILGFLLIGSSLACLAIAMESIGESVISTESLKIISITGFSLFTIFIIYALKIKEKSILNLNLFKNRTYRSGVSGNIIAYISTGGISFILPLLFQIQFGMSPAKSGLLVAPFAVGGLIMRAISPKIIKKFGFKKTIAAAPFGISLSLILIGFITKESSTAYIVFVCAMLGFFNILLMSSNGPLIYVDIPKSMSANATSLDITIRQFSSGLSVGFISFLLISFLSMLNTHIFDASGIKAFQYSFFVLAGIILVQFLISLGIKANDGEEAARGAS